MGSFKVKCDEIFCTDLILNKTKNSTGTFLETIMKLRLPSLFRRPLFTIFDFLVGTSKQHQELVEKKHLDSFSVYFKRPMDLYTDRKYRQNTLKSPVSGKVVCLRKWPKLAVKKEVINFGSLDPIYENGNFLVLYLHPGDYHRVHAPIDLKLTNCSEVYGKLKPMRKLGFLRKLSEQFRYKSFVENYKKVLRGTTAFGKLELFLVGSKNVGSVYTNTGDHQDQGLFRENECLGSFDLGGSAVVLFTEKNRIAYSVKEGQTIRVGDVIGQFT